MFRTVPLFIIRSVSLYTQQWYMSYRFADSCQQTCMTYTTAVWPDDEQRNCPKYIQFYSKNKFEKLVHLVGFIIRIYHDARSPERQICFDPKLEIQLAFSGPPEGQNHWQSYILRYSKTGLRCQVTIYEGRYAAR